jgi:hypothetical protein
MLSNTVHNFTAGSTYKLTFDYGRQTPTFEVLTFGIGGFGSGVVGFGAVLPTLVSTSFSFLVTTDFVGSVYFAGLAGMASNLLIDNVVLEDVTPIPVPPALLLLGSSLVGASALKRRRRS